MKFEAVIFDLDGTLIDSMGIWAEVDIEFLKKRQIAVPENLFSDMTGGNSFNDLAIYFKDKFHLTESLEDIKQEWTNMVEEHYTHHIKLKPGAYELVSFLYQNNIPLAIGTSNSELLTRAVLTNNNLTEFFRAIVSGCQEIKGKPNPDIFLKAAKSLAVSPERCLVIEDTIAGVMGSINANMTVWSVFDRHAETERSEILKNSHKDFNNMNDLFDYIKGNYESLF